MNKAVRCTGEFSAVSGLSRNLNKSVLLPIKECDLSELDDIPVKNTVTYLGVVIDKNENNRCHLNFNPIIQQITKKFHMWLMRDLSLNGRVLLSEAEGISWSVCVSLSLEMPLAVYKKLEKVLYDFIWRNKCQYLKKEILCNPRSKGGVEVLRFETVKVESVAFFCCCLWTQHSNWAPPPSPTHLKYRNLACATCTAILLTQHYTECYIGILHLMEKLISKLTS